MDALATILRSVRLESVLLSRASLGAPFAVESAGARTTIFHAVLSGSCCVQLAGGRPAERLDAGEAVVVGPMRRHIISDAPGRAPVPISSLGAIHTPSGVPLIRFGATSAPTRILCGTLELDHPAGEGFLDLLPDLLLLTSDGSTEGRFLAATLELLDRELERDDVGAAEIATRLADVVLVLALRRVQAAADLMRRRELSTLEIAERVGYSSEDALGRMFKRTLGTTPSAFRRRLLESNAQTDR